MTKDLPQTRPVGKPTLKTVAQATGYAVTTVSRALANDPKIAQTTRDTVATAAKTLGYVPDRAAQRLRTGRTKVISLLINPGHEYLGFTHVLLNGITAALRGTGYSVTITPDFIDSDRISVIRNILRNNLADGIVLSRTECFDPRVRLLLEQDFPFVSHGRTEFTTPHAYVDFDNEAFARQSVQWLLKAGRRRLMIVLPQAQFTFSQHLRFGFLSEVREAGIEHIIPEDLSIDTPPAEIARRLKEMLLSDTPPDGIVCVGEVMALAALAAIDDARMVAGDQVDMLIKQASPVFDLMRPKFRSIFEDVEKTGQQMGEILLRRIDGEPPETLQRIIAPVDGPHLRD
ncbi:LacI family transcriptional regulator [Puniceibacterium sediminis]|uniref:Transcriptional regulator, LacI family n=1 Tax=Puniceibacterium sediminis TaxID=1608407 RepID=A0A238VTN5_9RHOB|nr:LacI family transcriptional regulator [Puniceibacterium sediminis]SNR37517.1 transcriptional regulator, LacI family [Puniceibacterium sediminis]